MITIYYYILNGTIYGSLNAYKIKQMSERDSDGKVYSVKVNRVSDFHTEFFDSEWLG